MSKKTNFITKHIISYGSENIKLYILTFKPLYNIISIDMKKLLTVAVCDKPSGQTAPNAETEILYAEIVNEKTLSELFKQAKGKYTVLVEGDFTFEDNGNFTKKLDKENADIITFDGGCFVKTSILKNLPIKSCVDIFSAEMFGAFTAKTVLKTDLKLFNFSAVCEEYSETAEENLTEILREFKISKARLNKDVYAYITDALVIKLISFYISAMLAIRRKTVEADALKKFDLKLKENIVLYLALEKRFIVADLKKLREKDFKISFLQYKKFERALNKNATIKA